ncbi:MAG: putative S-layer protein, partial [Candidatus Nanoarchaeia archaeon]
MTNTKITNRLIALTSIFLIFFISMSLASAGVLTLENTSTIPPTINHGEKISIEFNISYTGAQDNITISWSGLPSSYWDFPDVNLLNQNESRLVEAYFEVPEHEAPQIINAKIEVDGTSSSHDEVGFDIEINEDTSFTLSQSGLSKTSNGTLIIENTGNVRLEDIELTTKEDADFEVEFNDTDFDIVAGDKRKVEISSPDAKNLKLGDDNKITVIAKPKDVDAETLEVEVPVSFCEAGEQGNLEIEDFDIDNLGDGKDDEWYPLDEIEIEVEVENIGDDEIDDVIVEIMILDSNGKDVTKDFDLDDEEIDLGDIDDGDEELAVFKIKELPADLDDGNYDIYVKAYAEGKEDEHCVDTSSDLSETQYHEISIEREEDEAVIAKDYPYTLTGKPGDSFQITFDVYNIGEEEEEEVLVQLFNNDLDIDLVRYIRRLDRGDREEVTFNMEIPDNAEAGSYYLDIFTYFDYDEDDVLNPTSYDKNSLDDLEERYIIRLEVEEEPLIEPSISAKLISEAIVNEQLDVEVSITNHNEEDTFTITPTGYEAWATLEDAPESLTIQEDETRKTTISFLPSQSGQQTFTLEIDWQGETIEQEIQVNIKEPSG